CFESAGSHRYGLEAPQSQGSTRECISTALQGPILAPLVRVCASTMPCQFPQLERDIGDGCGPLSIGTGAPCSSAWSKRTANIGGGSRGYAAIDNPTSARARWR